MPMADGKWIDDLRPEQSLHDAARHALRLRLEVVRDALPAAIAEVDRDPEHVHRLRVATRRADAVLRIFRSTLPDKDYRHARKRLRRIRRASGAIRDWDVFRIDVSNRRPHRPQKEHAGLDFLSGYALGQRMAAHPNLENAAGGHDSAFKHLPSATVAAVVSASNGATLIQLARPLLSSLLHRLEEAVQGDLSDYSHLHQVRIAGKRLRYAMELFPTCFPTNFRDVLYPRVEEMQEILGQANDSHVAAGRLVALRDRLSASATEWKRLRAGVEGVLRSHNTRLPQTRRRFLAWWKQWSRDEGHELTRLLRIEASAS
jgi:CHAD domain-containing protein